MARTLAVIAIATALAPSLALADSSAGSSSPSTTVITINGSVNKICSLGAVTSNTLNVGTLINPSNGTLGSIASQNTSVTGSWCNTASTISVLATPMVAQSFIGAPPTGFTKAINYTASLTGWTPNVANFVTNGNDLGAQSSNTPGSQDQTNPEAATITVAVGTFKSPNSADLLVADPNYSGEITITLTPK